MELLIPTNLTFEYFKRNLKKQIKFHLERTIKNIKSIMFLRYIFNAKEIVQLKIERNSLKK